MRKWTIRLLVLAAIVGGVWALKLTVLAPAPVSVTVARVARGHVESAVTNSSAGTVRARRRASISPDVSGRVVDVPHREGARVTAGDVLVRIDDTVARARLAVARCNLEASRALASEAAVNAKLVERQLERERQVAARGLVPAGELDRIETAHLAALAAVRTSQARAKQAQAEVALAEAQKDKNVLRAPFDGILAEVSVELGEWITPAPPLTPVPPSIDLIDPSSIYISAPMDETDSSIIRKGQPVRISIDSIPNRSFPGRVVRVSSYVLDVQAQNRTVEIEAELDDDVLASTLLPGTSADVEVIIETHPDALRIPTISLIEGGKVLVVEGDVLVEHTVSTALRSWSFVEVLSGLEPGDRVVTNLENQDVKAGAEVTVEREMELSSSP
ncbi:MAG: efflux RND transporter periplasmic adaptor subunit [Planctomycetota bacterium]|jgi:HlyD family secretion protein